MSDLQEFKKYLDTKKILNTTKYSYLYIVKKFLKTNEDKPLTKLLVDEYIKEFPSNKGGLYIYLKFKGLNEPRKKREIPENIKTFINTQNYASNTATKILLNYTSQDKPIKEFLKTKKPITRKRYKLVLDKYEKYIKSLSL